MIPRQGRGRVSGRGDRSIILGGAKGCFLNDIDIWYDNKHDDEEMPGVKKYFEGFMEKHFVGWKGNERGNVDHVWSGGEYPKDFAHHADGYSFGILERSIALCG